jgi:DinB superfamily
LPEWEIHEELDSVRSDFRALVTSAPPEALARGTNGTKWTNEQLLFHMLFGYLLVWNLLGLVHAMSRLPNAVSRGFAAALNSATRPFHAVNYVGSLGGARVLGQPRMCRLMDRVTHSLERRLDRESPSSLQRGMHFPVGWDPYFTDVMSVRDVYHYPTQHYDHHRAQLTLDQSAHR